MNIRRIPSCTPSIKQNVKCEKQRYLYSDSLSIVHCSPTPQNKEFPGSIQMDSFIHFIKHSNSCDILFHSHLQRDFFYSSVLSFCGKRYKGLLSYVPNISQFHNHIIAYHFLGSLQFFLRCNFRIPLTSNSNLDELLSRNATRLSSCSQWNPRLVAPFLPSQTLHLTLGRLQHIFKHILKIES